MGSVRGSFPSSGAPPGRAAGTDIATLLPTKRCEAITGYSKGKSSGR